MIETPNHMRFSPAEGALLVDPMSTQLSNKRVAFQKLREHRIQKLSGDIQVAQDKLNIQIS